MSELMNEEILSEEEQRFVVDDDQKAEWCMKKIREAQQEAQEWAAFYKDQADKAKLKYESRIAWFEHLLRPYFDMVPHKATATQQSYVLPSGKLVVKQQQPEYVREDEKILEWMAEQDTDMHFIKVKESVDWAEFKKVLTRVGDKMVTEDGVIVPGITVSEREPVFKVEVKA